MSQDNQKTDTTKVPSQIFRWFEKMKMNYEHNVQKALQQFESFTVRQQTRLDQANDQHIANLKNAHQTQANQHQQTIKRLEDDAKYYQQQLARQQQSIEQLNTRYDAVMSCLLADNKQSINIKTFINDNNIEPDNTLLTSPINDEIEITRNHHDKITEDLFEQALHYREADKYKQAIVLFKQAAQQGHAKAMGAMARAYFLAEGVEEDHLYGLAWLIIATNNDLQQAMSKVQKFQQQDPELYEEAMQLSHQLSTQII